MLGKARVVASIEARMNSSRLPGKVLMDVYGEPALTRLLNRLRRCRLIDAIVLATTTNAEDNVLVDWAHDQEISVHRGSEHDVLQRVIDAHTSMQSDIIVEITGDCLLLDPQIIDMGIQTFLHSDCDVVTNVKYLSYPMGMDVQVFGYTDLVWVSNNIQDSAVREHVSLYFYEHPERYRVHHMFAPLCWHAPTYRLMLDYKEDLQLINEIYRRLYPHYGDTFGINEIITLLRAEPPLTAINSSCENKAVR